MPLNQKKLNLVVAAHPHCPCSIASLSELKQALAVAPGAADIHLVYFQPAGASVEWSKTELIEKSAALPTARIWYDKDGTMAAALGARTSFDVFLFNHKGDIIFRGGITRGRGIHGDNRGRSALEAALKGSVVKESHPVYGCPLQKNPKNFQRKV